MKNSKSGLYAQSCSYGSIGIVNSTQCSVQTPLSDDTGYGYSFSGSLASDCNGDIDTDGDGLRDSWEMQYFGNFTSQNGSGDFDGDGLVNALEQQFGTNPTAADTDGDGLGDPLEYELSFNVNDPAQDYGNEQNTQFESTCAVLNGKVIVAYVDSNQGVYALGSESRLSSRTPRLVGYSVSQDNGVSFTDKGNPPLSTQGAGTSDAGDAGDPVLAVDKASSIVYLAGTSPRNTGFQGIPFWKSTDGGVTFGNPIMVRNDITTTDKPWIAVDNATGTGQHDVYLSCTSNGGASGFGIWLTVSTMFT